jgi:hypothetical protein
LGRHFKSEPGAQFQNYKLCEMLYEQTNNHNFESTPLYHITNNNLLELSNFRLDNLMPLFNQMHTYELKCHNKCTPIANLNLFT